MCVVGRRMPDISQCLAASLIPVIEAGQLINLVAES